jgi:hypothetical protein
MTIRISISLISIFLIAACCSSNITTAKLSSDHTAYKKIADEKYSKNYNATFNSDSTYLFVYTSPKNLDKVLPSPLKFFVYDNNNEKVIFEDNLANGKIRWLNIHQIQVSINPEIISGKEEENNKMYGYIYDVLTQRKLSELDKNK